MIIKESLRNKGCRRRRRQALRAKQSKGGSVMRFDEKGLPVPGAMSLVVANLCDNELV